MVESNKLTKEDFNIDRDSIPHEQQQKNEKPSEFYNLEKLINADNLIYKYKTEGRSPKDFSVYQNLIDLFKNLRDGNINPTEVLSNQVNLNQI